MQVSLDICQPEAAIWEDAEELADWSSGAVLMIPLLVHTLSIKQDLVLAVQDLHWWIVHAQPEEVVLKVVDLHAVAASAEIRGRCSAPHIVYTRTMHGSQLPSFGAWHHTMPFMAFLGTTWQQCLQHIYACCMDICELTSLASKALWRRSASSRAFPSTAHLQHFSHALQEDYGRTLTGGTRILSRVCIIL